MSKQRHIMDTSPRPRKKAVITHVEEVHEHKWKNGALLDQERVSVSPCSTWDDHIWTNIIQVQDCECGATRRLLMGYKNRRRRGDDLRRQSGLGPLGTPLTRSGIYNPPRILK